MLIKNTGEENFGYVVFKRKIHGSAGKYPRICASRLILYVHIFLTGSRIAFFLAENHLRPHGNLEAEIVSGRGQLDRSEWNFFILIFY